MPDRLRPRPTTIAHPTVRLQGWSDKCATGAKTTTTLPKERNNNGYKKCSLSTCGKVQALPQEFKFYRWDVLAEVKWTGFGETTTDEGHKIWYCEEDSKHQYGVVFSMRKKVVGSIISCTPISSRLISIRISARPRNITVIQSLHQPRRRGGWAVLRLAR